MATRRTHVHVASFRICRLQIARSVVVDPGDSLTAGGREAERPDHNPGRGVAHVEPRAILRGTTYEQESETILTAVTLMWCSPDSSFISFFTSLFDAPLPSAFASVLAAAFSLTVVPVIVTLWPT